MDQCFPDKQETQCPWESVLCKVDHLVRGVTRCQDVRLVSCVKLSPGEGAAWAWRSDDVRSTSCVTWSPGGWLLGPGGHMMLDQRPV